MKYVVGALALVLALWLGDRLRQIKWPTSRWCCWLRRRLGMRLRLPRPSRSEARPIYVAMYLTKLSFALGVFGVAMFTDEVWWRLGLAGLGILGILLWCVNTRRQWADGPPPVVLSQDADFDSRPHQHVAPRRRHGDQPALDIEL